MAPPTTSMYPRMAPSASIASANASIVPDDIGPYKYLPEFLKNMDTRRKMIILGITATIGISCAALYFGLRSSSESSFVEEEKEIEVRGIKRKSRVAFSEESQNQKVSENNGESDLNSNKNVRPARPQNNVLVLKQCPRGRKTPCIALFPLKLETFLRVHKIKYELDFNGHEPKPYGSPWIRFNSEDIPESENVIEFLIDNYDIKPEKELSDEQKTVKKAYTHLVENHLHWGLALWRWVYDGARNLKEIQLLPSNTRRLIPDVCKTVEQAAWSHGIGKMNPEDVKKAVIKDLRSLSEYLGEKNYFLGTKTPTELDCAAFGLLSQFLWNMHGPYHYAVAEKYKNLREFCWRMRLNYWPDWEECLNNTEFYSDEPYPLAEFLG